MRGLRGAAAPVAVLCAVSLVLLPVVFLALNRGTFGVTAGGILLSALLSAGALAAIVLLGQLLTRALKHELGLVLPVVATLAAVQSVMFTLVYVGSFYSNQFWDDNLTHHVVTSAILNPEPVLDFLGIATDTPLAHYIIPAAAGIVLVLIALMWLLLLRTVARVWPRDWHVSPLYPLAVLLCCVAVGLPLAVYAPRATKGEPLLDFFAVAPSRGFRDWTGDQRAAALAGAQDERTYPVVKGSGTRKNVVIILSDSIRADHLDVYGYGRHTTPFLSSLVAQKRAAPADMVLSTCSASYCGIASMLASVPYSKLSRHNFKLNSVLKRAGYRVSYYLSGDHRGWRYLWDFYGHDIDDMRDCTARSCSNDLDDRETIADFKNVAPFDGQPRFFFFFLMSSHRIGTKIPEYQRFQPVLDDIQLVATRNRKIPAGYDQHGVPLFPPFTAQEKEAIINRYDNGILQADAMVQSIFSVLKEKGYLDNSIVVFSSDHGESSGERGYLSHGRSLYQTDMRVPLVIYDENADRYRGRPFAAQIDIAPTVLDRLGLPIPSGWDGVSLLRPMVPRVTWHQTSYRQRPCAAAVQWSSSVFRKYIRCANYDQRISEELFDLRDDPSESRNIVSEAGGSELEKLRAETLRLLGLSNCPGRGKRCGQPQ